MYGLTMYGLTMYGPPAITTSLELNQATKRGRKEYAERRKGKTPGYHNQSTPLNLC
jgi:hypothetical protein